MARYTVKKEKVGEVKKAIINFVNNVTKKEPGTLAYEAFQEEDKVSFIHIMCFKDEKSKKFHETSEHVKRFVDILYPNCEEEPIFTQLNLIKSKEQ